MNAVQGIEIIEKATSLLECAETQLTVHCNRLVARDSISQCHALISLLSESEGIAEDVKVCQEVLNNFIDRLEPPEHAQPPVEQQRQQQQPAMSAEATEAPPLHASSRISKAVTRPRTLTSCFGDIIGCERAKQLLLENVVLPLTLDEPTRAAVFSGIRAGAGNVLLHGPPGTGKTLLAQVRT